MRRHIINDPRGPATMATAMPAAAARSMKSSRRGIDARGWLYVVRQGDGLAMQVVLVIVLVRIHGEPVRPTRAEQFEILGMTAHRLRFARAADVVIETDD